MQYLNDGIRLKQFFGKSGLFMELAGKRILVIGGAGFIGSHVVGELLKTDIRELVIFDNFTRGKLLYITPYRNDTRCTIYGNGGDIRDIDLLNDAMHGIDGVIHLAAMWLLHCKDFPRTAFTPRKDVARQ